MVKINQFKNKLLNYTFKFAKINKKPNLIDLFPYLVYSFFKGHKYRKDLLRIYRICKLPVFNNKLEPNTIVPEIELIVNSVRKDFCNLHFVINYAILNSLNRISCVTIAVPKDQVIECQNLIHDNKHKNIIKVISEDSIINSQFRNKILENFPNLYGWILQQFLTLESVLNSKAKGVLQVNSDTILLRPTLWLDHTGTQPILVSTEFHPPYYILLNKINQKFPINPDSHVTHHMLFQPALLRKILEYSNINSISDLLEYVINYCDRKQNSPMCIEFELYALGMLTYFPSNVEISKFGNVSFDLKSNSTMKKINKLSKKYNSISSHHYL
jgi:hypothetical protein